VKLDSIEISISDTGIGMDNETLQNCLKLKIVLLHAAPKMKKEQVSACSFVKNLWKKTAEKFGWTAKKEKEAHLHFQFH